MHLIDFIEADYPILKTGNTISDAIDMLESEKETQFIFLDDDGLTHVFQEQDIELLDDQMLLSRYQARYPEVYVNEYDFIYLALEYMSKRNLEICPVFSENDEYRGVVRLNSILKWMSQKEFEGEGSIILLQINDPDYHLSDISRILESENLKIKVLRPIETEEGKHSFLIRLNKKESMAGIHSLRRFGYNVDLISGSDSEINVDKERYDLLMKYLEL